MLHNANKQIWLDAPAYGCIDCHVEVIGIRIYETASTGQIDN